MYILNLLSKLVHINSLTNCTLSLSNTGKLALLCLT